MTSDAACLALPDAISNTIVEQVRPSANASVTIAASTTTICAGTDVSFTASPVNGGPSPKYQWQVNGRNLGSDNPVFTTADLANGDMVNCILTSSLSCSVPAAAQNQVVMTVNANPTVVMMPDTIIALGQSVDLQAGVTGPVTSYQWTPTLGLNNANAATPVATPDNTTTYQVIAHTAAGCMAGGKVTVGVFKAIRMPSAFTPNGDGNNDLFRIPPSLSVKIKAFAVYDRWGERVFFTKNSTTGWDGYTGGQPQPTGTYVWMIEYDDLLTGRPTQAKGTVILTR
jgi:gliding motility-associated-like protein